MKTPLTSRTLRHHFTYSWWKYLLIAVVSYALVSFLYTVTAYRPPRDKTVSLYVCGYINEPALENYMENVREAEMPDMEEMNSQILLEDSSYGAMQIMTYLAAGEGDIYLLPREQFLSNAESGSLVPLENDTELMAIFDEAGVSLQSGWRRDSDTGETHLYGIPQSKLPGLSQYVYAADGFLSIIITSRNQENAAKFLRILCRDTVSEPEVQEITAP